MLNTTMALWNRGHGQNRHRIVKLVFAILFITGSASLFLFTLNSSAWSPFVGAQEQQTEKEKQPTVSNSHGIVIAGNTPVGDNEAASVTSTARKSSTKVMVQPSCVPSPGVVAQQRTTTIPQNVITYSEKSSQGKQRSERSHAYPKAVQIKKLHSGNRSDVKVVVPSVSHAKKTVPMAPPGSPIATSTIQPPAAPVATAEVIATTTPGDGTAVSNMPAIVTTNATPDMSTTSSTQFTGSLGQKGALLLVKSGKNSSDK